MCISIKAKQAPDDPREPVTFPFPPSVCFYPSLFLPLLSHPFSLPHLGEKRVRKEGVKLVSSPFTTSRTIKTLITTIPTITKKAGQKTRKPLAYVQGVLNPSTYRSSLREMVHDSDAHK